ncbi:hypothetical protein ACIBG6_11025 [Streptomyces sp. NPDC050842]|uniref:hypothetical protein n=1 Tax=Streptomyces sp. NPDC050842 TaxID=3365636 RepID=UPI0037AEFA97
MMKVLLIVVLNDVVLNDVVRRKEQTPRALEGIPVRRVTVAHGRIGAVSNVPRRSDRAR